MSSTTRHLLFTLTVVMFATSSMYAQTLQPECNTLGFCPHTINAATDRAISVFAADLNGDGNIDVLSASQNDGKIAWYENTDGLGAFGPQQIITTVARGATSVFAADLDGDGDTDVLVASQNDDKIAWFENTDGLGTFGPQQGINTDFTASSVFAADLDGDGDIDVLSASGNKIAWYENTDGLGTFGSQQIITTNADLATSVFAADLDGDGDIDVLSASGNKIAWYENTDGLGTFGPQQIITTNADRARSVFAADLDGDGDFDVLSASTGDDKIAWYKNTDGMGNFGSQMIITTATNGPFSVFAVDLDGDGDNDVLSASVRDDKIAWYENTDGFGTFGPQQVITAAADGALSVFAADLDGDGDTDVLSASVFDDKIAWYENECDCNGNGVNDICELARATSFDCNENGFLDECDINDGTSMDCNTNDIPDECEIDCNDNDLPDECDITHGTSADCNGNDVPDECDVVPSFSHSVITTSANGAYSVFAADLDGDGDIDVLSASIFDGKIAWYENSDGLGTFGPQQIIAYVNGAATSVFAIDLDGDGDKDVLSASLFIHKIAWYENIDGLGTFGPQQVITTNANAPFSVFAADLDGDGDTDVLSASTDDDKIAWYENTDGLGSFGLLQVITTAADGAESVFALDLDGDGDIDVLSASANDNKIAWYENTDGLGTFGPQIVITTDVDTARSVFAADMDGDGDTDVLSASTGDDKIAWYENTDGLGSFGLLQVITTAADGAWSVFALDLDGDGDIDVLSASFVDDTIAWYENTDGLGTFGPQLIISDNADEAHFVFAEDLDGDGDYDVISASRGDDKIAWYENMVAQNCNRNQVPDECEPDCNMNGIPDDCEDCCFDTDCEDDGDVCTDKTCQSGVCIVNNICGACCDRRDALCQDGLLQDDCTGSQLVWSQGETCGTVLCDLALGACCSTRFGTCSNIILAQCSGTHLNWTKGENCTALNCPDPFIPAVSQWGLVILTLLLLIVAKIYFNRRLSSTQAIRVPPTRGDATP